MGLAFIEQFFDDTERSSRGHEYGVAMVSIRDADNLVAGRSGPNFNRFARHIGIPGSLYDLVEMGMRFLSGLFFPPVTVLDGFRTAAIKQAGLGNGQYDNPALIVQRAPNGRPDRFHGQIGTVCGYKNVLEHLSIVKV